MTKPLALLALLAACHQESPPVSAELPAARSTPATPLLTLDGKQIDLAAYRKKVTLIAFWGTFCEPCLKELPMLSALYDKTRGDPDRSIIAVSTDEIRSDADRAHVAQVASGLKLTMPVLIDAKQVLKGRFAHKDGAPADAGQGELALPTTVVLLSSGHYARQSGFDMSVPVESFVSDGMATLARAEAGTLPDDRYDDAPVDPSAPAQGGTFKIIIPAIPKAGFETEWPKLEAKLKGKVPADKLAVAKAELMAGKPTAIEIPVPAPHAPAKSK